MNVYITNPCNEVILDMSENFIWVSKSGTHYTINDMTSTHIRNSIRAIEAGKIKGRDKFIIPFKKELARRETKMGELIYG